VADSEIQSGNGGDYDYSQHRDLDFQQLSAGRNGDEIFFDKPGKVKKR
jgi:hypothetical protein